MTKDVQNLKSEDKFLFHWCILILRKCPIETPFQHTVPSRFCAQPPPDFQTYLRSCTVLLSFLLLRYIVSGSDLFAGHALCLWGEKLGAILAKQRSNQVTTHILLPSLLASITGGQIPCRSVSLRTRLLQYCRLTLKSNRELGLKMKTKTKPKATRPSKSDPSILR